MLGDQSHETDRSGIAKSPVVRQADLVEQRPEAYRRCGQGAWAADNLVAHVSTDLLVVGAGKGVPGKVVATLMGHAKVDTTLNVYTQVLEHSLRGAAEKVGSELITIDHQSKRTSGVTDQIA
jgi:integrase